MTGDTRRLEYDECFWCAGTGRIKSGFIRKWLFGYGDYYECVICGGDGKHIGDFQTDAPRVYRSTCNER